VRQDVIGKVRIAGVWANLEEGGDPVGRDRVRDMSERRCDGRVHSHEHREDDHTYCRKNNVSIRIFSLLVRTALTHRLKSFLPGRPVIPALPVPVLNNATLQRWHRLATDEGEAGGAQYMHRSEDNERRHEIHRRIDRRRDQGH
jgi:hypothetical protein